METPPLERYQRSRATRPSIYQVWKEDDSTELEARYFEAIYQSHANVVRECLKQGVNPNVTDDDGLAGLHHASIRGDWAMGQVLMTSRKVNINLKDVEKSITPLMYAAIYGHARFVMELLRRGANPNLMSDKLRTALHMACTKNHIKCCQTLIAKGARLNVRDVFDNSPLSIAMIERGSVPLTRLLLRRGASATKTRQFPLFLDVILNCHTAERLETIELMLIYDVDIYCVNPITKRNCLHYLGLTGYLPAAKLLVPLAESNLENLDFTDRKPLDIAWDHGNLEMYRYFLQWEERMLLFEMLEEKIYLNTFQSAESNQ